MTFHTHLAMTGKFIQKTPFSVVSSCLFLFPVNDTIQGLRSESQLSDFRTAGMKYYEHSVASAMATSCAQDRSSNCLCGCSRKSPRVTEGS